MSEIRVSGIRMSQGKVFWSIVQLSISLSITDLLPGFAHALVTFTSTIPYTIYTFSAYSGTPDNFEHISLCQGLETAPKIYIDLAATVLYQPSQNSPVKVPKPSS